MEKAYTFNDVLIEPKYSEVVSRSLVDLSTDLGNIKLKLPIISANMKTITGPKMAIAMSESGGLGILHRFNTIEDAIIDFNETNQAGVSIGVQEEDKQRFDKLYEAGSRIFCIDVANAHHILVKNMMSWIYEKKINDITLIVGNIATTTAAEDLTTWGADIIKIGLGSGKNCITRQQTGVGVPQLYALEKISQKIDYWKYKTKIISDGGVTCVGDICKAMKYADAVMIGSLISGSSETPGNVYRNADGQFYKQHNGSASGEAKGQNKFVEGIATAMPFKGKVKYILREIKHGLCSAFSYVNANNLHEFQQKCEFIEISDGAMKESKL